MNATPHEWARWCTDSHAGSTRVNAMITGVQPSACHAARRNDTGDLSLQRALLGALSFVSAALLLGVHVDVARGQCLAHEITKRQAHDTYTGDHFGESVAVCEDIAVIGVPRDTGNRGSAWIFRFDGLSWNQDQKLLPGDPGAADDYFGCSVAVSGLDTAVVGAYYDDDNGQNSGSAYVFRFDGSIWYSHTKLLPSDGEAGDRFGSSVAISGDTAVIGAPWDDDHGTASGSAYIFRFNGSSWVQQAKLLAADAAESDFFGDAVSISGDLAVIGAKQDDDNGFNSGSAYVFHWNGSTWGQDAKLLASDGAERDEFGYSVSVSGDIVLVGAWHADASGADSGSAYAFRFDGSQWIEEAKLLASDGAAGDYFGSAVAVSGQAGVIGAPRDDDDGADSGSAYFCSGLSDCNENDVLDACDVVDGTSQDSDGNGIPDECEACYANEVTKLLASDGEPAELFGRSVAISGRVAIVGEPRDAVEPYGWMVGSAYICRYDGSSWIEEQKLLASDGQTADNFGGSVAICGDIAVVGAVYAHGSTLSTGSAYVFRFDGTNWLEEQELAASDGEAYDLFGRCVSICGDVIVVGADGDNDARGSAYVFRHDGSSWIEEQKLTASDQTAGDLFGYAVAVSHGVAVIGADRNDDQGESSGSAYVFRYSSGSWVQEAKLLPADGEAGDHFGTSVAISSDEVIVGAPRDDDAFPADPLCESGSAYVFHFDGSTWTQEAKLVSSYGEAGDQFGWSVAISEDSAVIGAAGENGVYSPWWPGVGAAYAFWYDGSQWIEGARLLASDGAHGDCLGISVALFHDTAVLGAYLDNDNGEDSGSAYVFAGLSDRNNNGTLDTCDIASGFSQDNDGNGVPDECETPGDVDGDGDVDLADLAALLAAYGSRIGDPAYNPYADIDRDGDVDLADLAELLAHYGEGT